jgi:hypothetical protein
MLHELQENGTCFIDDPYKTSLGELTTKRLRDLLKEMVDAGLASIVVNSSPEHFSTELPVVNSLSGALHLQIPSQPKSQELHVPVWAAYTPRRGE